MAYINATNNYATSRYIVGPSGQSNYLTIASAITAAAAAGGGDVFILSGTYTENLTMVAGVNLYSNTSSADDPTTIILGNITCNYSGSCSISGIALQTNGTYAVNTTSGTPILNLTNCLLNANNAFAIYMSNSSAKINCYQCSYTHNGYAIHSVVNCNELNFYGCNLYTTGNPAVTSTIYSGTVNYYNCVIGCPIDALSTGFFQLVACYMNTGSTNTTCLTTNSTSPCYVSDSSLVGGSAPCITIGSGGKCIVSYVTLSSTASPQIAS